MLTAQTQILKLTNVYDRFNQLTMSITDDGKTVCNTYNGEGLRIRKDVNGVATNYLYEGMKVVAEYDGDYNLKAQNVQGLNLLMRVEQNATYYYMYNGHADVTALLSAQTGSIDATYYYDAFGTVLSQTGNVSNSYLYAGYQYDEETGLYYLNARMYDSVTARFVQEDTYRGNPNDPLSLNLYTYCANNPLVYHDPTGHFLEKLDNLFDWGLDKLDSAFDWTFDKLDFAFDWTFDKLDFAFDWTFDKLDFAFDWTFNSLDNLCGWNLEGLNNITDWAFKGLNNLSDLTFKGLNNLSDLTFEGLNNLSDLTFKGLDNLSDLTFKGLDNLSDWTSNSLDWAGDKLFDGLDWAGDNIHTILDIGGMVPGVGEFLDGVNALLYLAEGDYVNAAFSAAALIPFAGAGVALGKYAV
ncbi:MAG: hypothetical protein EOM05_11895, partial [Clostridia bacterium]|nr:hypothetical protein [Clostridia bacterium]